MKKEKIEKLHKLINKSKNVLLLTHIKIDGDAIGVVGTFYNMLKKMGKEVKFTNDVKPDKCFDFLQINKMFSENLDIKEYNPDLIICLDTASVEQLGDIYTNNKDFFKGKEIIVIDHHRGNTKFGTLNIVDKDASSTCEIVLHLIKKLGCWEYFKTKCVDLLLTGIITDTNIFYNKNTTEDTLSNAAKLVKMGGNINRIVHNLYYETSIEKTKLKGRVLGKLQTSKDGKIVWAKITKEDFKDTNTNENDTSGIINDMINVKGCEITFLLYEKKSGTKASFRSKSFDIGEFCTSFEGGGGHKLAAGFTSTKKINEVEKEILEKLNF